MSLILKRIAKALYGSFGHSSEDEQALRPVQCASRLVGIQKIASQS